MYYVVVITIINRKENAIKLQEILTKYGNIIKTRLGLHETKQEEHKGLVILHTETSRKVSSLVREINKQKGMKAKLVKI